ncbi:MAG: hypothetical protein ACYCU5_13980 [Actinomycetes bacterium]
MTVYRSAHGSGGTEGNSRLTAVAGGLLFVLLAAEGLTIAAIGSLLYWHLVLGVLMIGPLVLKLGSTLWRFSRYYTGAPAYHRKGPPHPVLRALGPVIILTTLIIIGTGIVLLEIGPASPEVGLVLEVHRVAFFLWFAAVSVHVLAYVWRVPGLAGGDWAHWRRFDPHRLGGVRTRRLLALASLGLGLVLVLALSPQISAWSHGFRA